MQISEATIERAIQQAIVSAMKEDLYYSSTKREHLKGMVEKSYQKLEPQIQGVMESIMLDTIHSDAFRETVQADIINSAKNQFKGTYVASLKGAARVAAANKVKELEAALEAHIDELLDD